MAPARDVTRAGIGPTSSSTSAAELIGRVAIIVVSYNNLHYLEQCLGSIWDKTQYPFFEVIVVDNGSGPDVVAYLRAAERDEPRLRVIRNGENFGFARANNIGIVAAGECEYVVLLNDDTIVTRGWLNRFAQYLNDPTVGVVGPVSNMAPGGARISVDYDTVYEMEEFANRYTDEHSNESFEVTMLAMYCIGMRRALLDEIGLLDERFEIGMFEDDDFSLRVHRAGYRVVCAKDVFVHHWGRTSFARMDPDAYDQVFAKNRRRYEEKWQISWEPRVYADAER